MTRTQVPLSAPALSVLVNLAHRYRRARRHYRTSLRDLMRNEGVTDVEQLSTSARLIEASLFSAMNEALNAYRASVALASHDAIYADATTPPLNS